MSIRTYSRAPRAAARPIAAVGVASAVVVAVLAGVLLAAGPIAAQAVPAPLRTADLGPLGTVLTAPSGLTLYVYLNDREAGKSVCTGQCETNWPPFRPGADAPPPAEPLSVIARLDGTRQYAWKGKPLYFSRTDKKPGDSTGHKFRDFWLVAQP